MRTVEELLRSGLRVEGVLIGPQLALTARGDALRAALATQAVATVEVSEAEFASAAETDTPQGVLAIAEIPARTLPDVRSLAGCRVLALDGVQDPGNVGTMLRTAGALGLTATVALPGTVDLWNAKVVRSAMGALFFHPASMADWAEFDAWRAAQDVTLWGADAQGERLDALVAGAPARLALAVGNEGAGLTTVARERSRRLVAVPAGGTDSLNVAVAAGILLYELRQ